MSRVATLWSMEGGAAAKLAVLFSVVCPVDRRDLITYFLAGMWLPIARTIIEIHGGRFWAEFAPSGRGVRFCFTLFQAQGGIS